jgi:hypothetical protein
MTLRTQDKRQALAKARRRQQTSDFAAIYAWRAGVEATMSWAVRSFGLRRARYVGLAKVRLQHIATAAALNLIRLTRGSMGAPIASTRALRSYSLTSRLTSPAGSRISRSQHSMLNHSLSKHQAASQVSGPNTS